MKKRSSSLVCVENEDRRKYSDNRNKNHTYFSDPLVAGFEDIGQLWWWWTGGTVATKNLKPRTKSVKDGE